MMGAGRARLPDDDEMAHQHSNRAIMPVLPRPTLELARDEYLARVKPWATDRLRRASLRQKHPVYDFLFKYYSFRPAHLLRWSPGADVTLEGATHDDVAWAEFVPSRAGLSLPAA